MDALKSLYYEQRSESIDPDDDLETNWRKDLRKKFESRTPFEFSYWS